MTPKSSARESAGWIRSSTCEMTLTFSSSSAHLTSSVHRTVLWNLYGFVVTVVGVIVEAPLFVPSATYSASPMSKVIEWPWPNFMGIELEREAMQDPYWTLPSHGSRISSGRLRVDVVK